MIVNEANLGSIFTGYKTTFSSAFEGAPKTWDQVAMRVTSEARDETYGWFGEFPRVREWIGDRVVRNFSVHGFTILNKDFEDTVAVSRNDVMDDRYGLFSPFFAEMGRAAAFHPDELLYALLASGFATPCYDGQYFFDGDHPVIDANGVAQTVSNTGGGSGTPWFLMDTSRAVKPLVFQVREDYQLEALTSPTDENVFNRNEFLYGVRARVNAGFGLWQLAYGSKQTLNADNYATARAAMHAFTGDGGRKLGVMPDTLVVGPSLEQAARKLIISQLATGGETNEWADTAKLIVTPYLD